MKKINNKGFTLIELLAVIVIMGILMLVAIPAISRIIENSRKDTFANIAKSYANSVKTAWTSDNLQCGGENISASAMDDGDYYILINTESDVSSILDQGGKSSWGNRNIKGYVRVNVTTNGDKKITKYYVALTDGTHGIYDDLSSSKESDKLVRGDILMNLNDSSDKLSAISITPFLNGEVTTCSSEGDNWSKWAPKYFAYGTPTTSSTQDYTTLTYPSGSNAGQQAKVFAGIDADETQKAICTLATGSLECFRGGTTNSYAVKEQKHLREVFGEANCSGDSQVNCRMGNFSCSVYSYGYVNCSDIATHMYCNFNNDGSVYCN